MKPTTGIRAAAVAAAVIATGLAAAGPASAAEANAAARTTARITSQEQLRASILKAVTDESVVCGAGASFSVHPMGGYPPPPIERSSTIPG